MERTEKYQRKQRKIQKHTRMAPTLIFPVLQATYLRGEDSEESLLGSRGGDEQGSLSTEDSPSAPMMLAWENVQCTAPGDVFFILVHVCASTLIHTHPHVHIHTYAHTPTSAHTCPHAHHKSAHSLTDTYLPHIHHPQTKPPTDPHT